MRLQLLHVLIVFIAFCGITHAQNDPLLSYDVEAQRKWVDSVYNSLNIDEKIGQLFMVMVFSNQDDETKAKILDRIKKDKIGGIIFSKGGPVRQARLNNEFQAIAKTPLLVAMDAEWGLNMRLDSTYAFPWNMTLGAIQDNGLIKRTGQYIGEHSKRMGVHFNFAPVVDINTNPNNPIIGNRSFGEDRNNVTEKALAFMEGMQQAGVMATAKHFPGHGDTDKDSHKTLPTISFSKQRIDSVEIYPYKKLISKGLASVMVAHLNVPSLEARQNYPSSISKAVVNDLLKENLEFKGLIFTDALNMKGVSDFSESGDIDLAAFKAGNDMLLISEDVSQGITKIKQAYESGEIGEERLAHSVKKVLKAKYKVGLNQYRPIGVFNLIDDLNRIKDQALHEDLMEHAITVIKNKGNQLPLHRLENKKIAYVNLGEEDGDQFYNTLKKYSEVHWIQADRLDKLINQLNNYNTVIVGVHKSNANPWKSHTIADKDLVWLYEIARTNSIILNIFAKPYALLDLKSHENFESIMVSYQNSEIAQDKAAQIIFGALPSHGVLPVSVGDDFKAGTGIKFPAASRLGYTIPERVGLNSARLSRIDSVAQHAVDAEMTPGIQLLVARRGKVIYNKNFGKHTYDGNTPVEWDHIYDVASLTKILSTMPLLMELVEKNALTLDTQLGKILPDYKDSNKKNVTVKQMLSHYAKLKPWIPFYRETLDSVSKQPHPDYYRNKRSKDFDIEVINGLYLRSDYPDSIQKIIKESDLLSRLRYRYSDLPYYILKKYIESYYDQPLDKLIQQRFLKPMGANYTTYNPHTIFSDSQIVPTEMDNYFRYREIRGYVHDMGAAMQDGVGGHAGVFSNANDVAKIMQLFLQKGYYGGKRYFRTQTMDKFNRCYYCENDNRRGIGFDKPQLGEQGPTCGCISMTSFGHSGFTGTYAWADPEEEIVYVFLANRTYPVAGRNRLLRENIRTEIQRLIYEAIDD
ncbi:MAG: serine hydrolase [Flavobacteriaceae bacterium]|nr:serine hydrolase [Bacteroidia bacterium]NNF76329.1 serine hydrolase [Flavobacteriaceae bacterium]